MRINWTEKSVEYLNRHNKQGDDNFALFAKQQIRAQKRLDDIARVVDEWRPTRSLDIGCGLGVIDILLAERYNLAHIHLLDGDGSSPIQHDYQNDMQPWNDVFAAAELVKQNVGKDVAVYPHLVVPASESMASMAKEIGELDMVCSFKSWGVHYPVSTYLQFAHEVLRPGGLLVIDIREERGDGDKNNQVEQAGFRLVKQLDARVRTFRRGV